MPLAKPHWKQITMYNWLISRWKKNNIILGLAQFTKRYFLFRKLLIQGALIKCHVFNSNYNKHINQRIIIRWGLGALVYESIFSTSWVPFSKKIPRIKDYWAARSKRARFTFLRTRYFHNKILSTRPIQTVERLFTRILAVKSIFQRRIRWPIHT